MAGRERMLSLPGEPADLKREMRALLEGQPWECARRLEDGRFLADALWEEWGRELEESGMDYGRFLKIVRGYAPEVWLWLAGEHIWEHCVSGLAGRVERRLPGRGRSAMNATTAEVCR